MYGVTKNKEIEINFQILILMSNDLYYPILITDIVNLIEILICVIVVVAIIDFNDQDESLKISGFLSMEWTDEYLQWDPPAYNGVKAIFLVSNSPQEYLLKLLF